LSLRPTEPPSERRRHPNSRLAGLDLLGTAVVVLDADGNTVFINHAASQLFSVSPKTLAGAPFAALFHNGSVIQSLLAEACNNAFGQKGQDIALEMPGRDPIPLHCLAVALESDLGAMLLEFSEVDQRLRIDREERLLDSARANRELVRNLAHEIKNPLGGIRGAAQLLEAELSDRGLREYTQVIIKEADRLQNLVDRLLAPHRRARSAERVNVHEVCERVRSIVIAEYPGELQILRDYDASLPELIGDKEQLIQALLNLVRNAAQALHGRGIIRLRTRIARHVVIARVRHKLALELHVTDNGPGIPAELLDRIFFPLVSGREGGSGLGLPLAQTIVEQHGGLIECESRPGWTDFKILLPLL
jgi:two-component system nitrogen regulation sensor histidine kinase GlnL